MRKKSTRKEAHTVKSAHGKKRTRINPIARAGEYNTKNNIYIVVDNLRGPTPFEDMIFYLWTDSNEICTAFVKLNSEHILFMRIF